MTEASFSGASGEASFGSSGYKRPKSKGLSFQQILALGIAAEKSKKRSFLGAVLKGGGHGLVWGFEQILRPSYGVAEGTRRALHGEGFDPEDFVKGFSRGVQLKRRTTFSDVLKQENVLKGHGRLRAVAGFGLDVVTDPTLPLQVAATIATGGAAAPAILAARASLKAAASVSAKATVKHEAAKVAERSFKELGPEFAAHVEVAQWRKRMADRELLSDIGQHKGPLLDEREQALYSMAERRARDEFAATGPKALQLSYKVPFAGKRFAITPTRVGGKRVAPKAFTLERGAKGEGVIGKIPGVKRASTAIGKTFRHGFLEEEWQKPLLMAAHMGEQLFDRDLAHGAGTIGAVLKAHPEMDDIERQLKTLDWAHNRETLINPADRSINEAELSGAVTRGALDQGQANFLRAWHEHTEYMRGRDKLFNVIYDKPIKRNKIYIPHIYEQGGMPLRRSEIAVPGFTKKKTADLSPAEWLRIHKLKKSGDRTLGTMERNLVTDPIQVMGIRTRRGSQAHAREVVLEHMRRTHGMHTYIPDLGKIDKIMQEMDKAKKVLDDNEWLFNNAKRAGWISGAVRRAKAGHTQRVTRYAEKAQAEIEPLKPQPTKEGLREARRLERDIEKGQGRRLRRKVMEIKRQGDIAEKNVNTAKKKLQTARVNRRLQNQLPTYYRNYTNKINQLESYIVKETRRKVSARKKQEAIEGQLRKYEATTKAAIKDAKRPVNPKLDRPKKIGKDVYASTVKGHKIVRAAEGGQRIAFLGGKHPVERGSHVYNLVDGKGRIHGSITYWLDDPKTVYVEDIWIKEPYRKTGAVKELLNLAASHGRPIEGSAVNPQLERIVERFNKRIVSGGRTILRDKKGRIVSSNRKVEQINRRLERLDKKSQEKVLRDIDKAKDELNHKTEQAIKRSEAAHKAFQHNAKRLETGGPYKRNPHIPEGWEKLNRKIGGEHFHFSPEIHESMSRIEVAMRSDEEMQKLANTAHKMMAKWKLAVTSINPGYRVRNTLSDVWNMYLSGVPTHAIVIYGAKAQRQYTLAQRVNTKAVEAARTNTELVLTKAERKAFQAFADASMHGVMSGLFQGDIQLVSQIIQKGGISGMRRGTTLLKEGRVIAAYARMMQDFNRHVENWGRFTHYLYRREAEKMAPDLAADWVKKAHFDYSELTPIEREKFRMIIPFYTWSRKNIPYQLTQFFAHPGRMATFPKFVRTSSEIATGEQQPPDQEGLMPSWLREKWAFQIPFFGADSYMTPMIGVGDLARLSNNPMEELLSMAGPWVKMPYEIGTGRSIFTGEKIDQGRREPIGGPAAAILQFIPGADVDKTARYPHGKRVEGPGASPWIKYLAGQVPMLQTALQFGSPIEKAKRGTAGPLSLRDFAYLSGVPVYERDRETEAVIAQLEMKEELKRLMKRLRDSGVIPPAERPKQSAYQRRLLRTIGGDDG